MPVGTAVRAVVRSPDKAAPLGLLCLRVGAFTFYLFGFSSQHQTTNQSQSQVGGLSRTCHLSKQSELFIMHITSGQTHTVFTLFATV